MPGLEETIAAIRIAHRKRRFAMKLQQKIDRSLESYIRINHTEWDPNGEDGASEKARAKANALVKALIKKARDGEGDKAIMELVAISDTARAPADRLRLEKEKEMEALAKSLPAAPWVKSVPGLGALGFATIVAEATGTKENRLGLSGYEKPERLWKRLGFAPYDGLAMSTWKRQTWRPRALAADEWTENPFKAERYAFMQQIIEKLLFKQTISKKKTASGETEPDGYYGEIYCRRRAHTKLTHPDWTDGHAKADAQRVTMKKLLRDLLREWRRATMTLPEKAHARVPAASEHRDAL